jgi:hypothetical protein
MRTPISTPTDNRNQITISFGKVTYKPGAPKGAPRWGWQCQCEQCISNAAIHGPFKTRREAEQDAALMIALAQVEDGTHH